MAVWAKLLGLVWRRRKHIVVQRNVYDSHVTEATVSYADFKNFFLDQYRSIFADAYLIVGDKVDALEVTDDALFRAFLNWKKISAYEKPGAWVRRIAIRIAVNYKKRRHRESAEFPTDLANTAGSETDRAAVLDLRNAVLKLAPQQRAAIVLFYYDDLTTAEVAAALNCRETTARGYLHEARLRLRGYLSE